MLFYKEKKKWNDAVKTIVGCGKGILGIKKLNNNRGKIYDDDKEEFSKEQKKSVDLQRVRELSQENILWRNLIANIYRIAEDVKSPLCAFKSEQL